MSWCTMVCNMIPCCTLRTGEWIAACMHRYLTNASAPLCARQMGTCHATIGPAHCGIPLAWCRLVSGRSRQPASESHCRAAGNTRWGVIGTLANAADANGPAPKAHARAPRAGVGGRRGQGAGAPRAYAWQGPGAIGTRACGLYWPRLLPAVLLCSAGHGRVGHVCQCWHGVSSCCLYSFVWHACHN